MTKLCSQTGLLNSTQAYTIDYDGHIIENTKIDNAFTYKKTEGYYPILCSINKLPIYLQNRKGNTPESYDQKNSVATALEQCRKENISVKKFRADACCYEKNTIAFLEQENITYYIRAEKNESLRIALEDETDWKPFLLNNSKIEVCSIEEQLFINR